MRCVHAPATHGAIMPKRKQKSDETDTSNDQPCDTSSTTRSVFTFSYPTVDQFRSIDVQHLTGITIAIWEHTIRPYLVGSCLVFPMRELLHYRPSTVSIVAVDKLNGTSRTITLPCSELDLPRYISQTQRVEVVVTDKRASLRAEYVSISQDMTKVDEHGRYVLRVDYPSWRRENRLREFQEELSNRVWFDENATRLSVMGEFAMRSYDTFRRFGVVGSLFGTSYKNPLTGKDVGDVRFVKEPCYRIDDCYVFPAVGVRFKTIHWTDAESETHNSSITRINLSSKTMCVVVQIRSGGKMLIRQSLSEDAEMPGRYKLTYRLHRKRSHAVSNVFFDGNLERRMVGEGLLLSHAVFDDVGVEIRPFRQGYRKHRKLDRTGT